jgi:FKBP-type peptidyl-prolyl cis-trans isomerase FkpA
MKYSKFIAAGCALMMIAGSTNAQTTKKKTSSKPAASTTKTNSGTKPASSATGTGKTNPAKPQPSNAQLGQRAPKYVPGPRTFSAPDAEGFITTNGNLQFKKITNGTSSYDPQIGDIADMNIKFFIGDSLLINTMEMNEGKPVTQALQAPHFAGDLNEGLLLLKAGDSAIFRMKMDTLSVRTKQPKPEWAKPDAYARWEVKMVNVKSRAEAEAERAERAKARAAEEENILQKHFAENGIKAQRTASGLYYVLHEPGTGDAPVAGNNVTVNYTGMLLDGTKFDSNVDPAFNHVSPFSFPLGQGRVIKGWDEGVPLMKKGGKITLYIPSNLAYGERSQGPIIKANSILIFEVELVDFK